MRRGGRLILLLIILIIVAGALVYFVLNQPVGPTPSPSTSPTEELTRSIVVARIDIPSNTVLTDTQTFLSTAEIPESEYNNAPNQYFTSPSELVNKQTTKAINFNERIRRSDVTDPGLSSTIPTPQQGAPRAKAVTFQVNNLSGVADQIKPGDFVDVLSSFIIQRTYLRPGFGDNNQVVIREEQFEGQTTKTLLQNVQVLQILKPPPPTEGSPTPGGISQAQGGPPQTDQSGQPVDQSQGGQGQQTAATPGTNANTFQQGSWLLILAVTDQQAELLKFSIEQGTGITLVLRGRGDTAIENTTGATLDLLVQQYGLPLPQPAVPAISSESQLTPLPTTNATVAPPATTPSLTVTPTP